MNQRTGNLEPTTPTIGIVGGMGPAAGLDLHGKILANTIALTDQDHIDVIHMSVSRLIGDRSAFLSDQSRANPGIEIARVMARLDAAGATVAGIPCNTAHSPGIFSEVERGLDGLGLKLLHMIDETIDCLAAKSCNGIGVLATRGTLTSRLYQDRLHAAGHDVVIPTEEEMSTLVTPAIYDSSFGIKVVSNPVSAKAVTLVKLAAERLIDRGARTIILGCTELPLAIDHLDGVELLDPTNCLARALIRETAPEKLAP